jgi:hypothetical protein
MRDQETLRVSLHRTQWVGLDGAPVTNAVYLSIPLLTIAS